MLYLIIGIQDIRKAVLFAVPVGIMSGFIVLLFHETPAFLLSKNQNEKLRLSLK